YRVEAVSSGRTPYTCWAMAGVVNTHIENRANHEKNCTTPNCFIALGIRAKSVNITAIPLRVVAISSTGGAASSSKPATSAGVYSRVVTTVHNTARSNTAARA